MPPTEPPPARRAPHRPALLAAAALLLAAAATPALARQPGDLAGVWDLDFDGTGASCRIQLRADRSDKGDFFLGMPSACRHAMPGIAAVGRWTLPDNGHLALADPGGRTLLLLAASGDGFALANAVGTYTLKPVALGRAAASSAAALAAAPAAVPAAAASTAVAATLVPAAMPGRAPAEASVEAPVRKAKAEPPPGAAEVAGRYAVMRDKRDTGCMVTLDRSRARGGDRADNERAQLAPGCRDQGIVVFDPSAWSLVHGELVLTARAGHKTRLQRGEDGVWVKDAKEGGKPLGLKKL